MNILVLTSVYPSANDLNENVTKVVKYFVQEWTKQGHLVKVIHNAHRYPMLVHLLPKAIKRRIASRINFYIPDYNSITRLHYQDGLVDVWRLPIFKMMPHGNHFRYSLKKQAFAIERILKSINFKPDIILGHWMSPQAQLLSLLKNQYDCRMAIVLHGSSYIKDERFNCMQYLKHIDAIGCRSSAEAEFIKSNLPLEKTPFVCYSGVPDEYISNYSFDNTKFSADVKLWRLVYAGRLIRYKNVDKILLALSKIDKDYVFDIIGDGEEIDNLKQLAVYLNISDKVVFHGRLERKEVVSFMRKANCFVMISQGEVFGLVYLEAMASSCITIASRKGGIDGVIKDGENGFLCRAGDEEELTHILKSLMQMDSSKLYMISKAGYKTAVEYTDSKVAKKYLCDAINW